MQDFFYEYFIKPITVPGVQGYNPVNTFVYAVILFAVAFLIFKVLDRKGVKFNKRFAFSLLPFILLGALLRAINSANLLSFIFKTPNPLEPGFWTFTPGVWFLVSGLALLSLWISRKVKGKKFHELFAGIGIAFCLPLALLCIAGLSNWLAFIVSIALVALTAFATKFLLSYALPLLENSLNFLAFSGQLLDALVTVIAISFFGFAEQHPLSDALIKIHPLLFVFLKAVLVLVLLHLVEKSFENKNAANFTRLIIIILGFSTGFAGLLKLGLV